jgi:hypothetical protein
MATLVREHEGSGGEMARAVSYEPWNDITEPGAYVFVDTGELARVPAEALAAGHSPVITFAARRPRMVARISRDPYIPLNKARQLAADADLPVNF